MQSLTDICNETNLTADDVRLILSDLRPDWETTETITHNEADLIRQSASAALLSGNGEITQVADMDLTQQEQLISNASQVLNLPLVLTVSQEIKMVNALHEMKNAAILNAIDCKYAELNAAISQRSESRQQAYLTAITDLANQMQKPVSVVAEMKAEIDATNSKLETLLTQVKAGKY